MTMHDLLHDDAELLYGIESREADAPRKIERPYTPRFERRTVKTAAHPCGINARGHKRRGR